MTVHAFNRRLLLRNAALLGGTGMLAGACATGAAQTAALDTAAPAYGSSATAEPLGLFGPKPGVALLSRNENPYGPSPKVAPAVAEATAMGAYYADTGALTKLIADKNGIAPEQVSLSSGSGEGLAAAALAFGTKGAILAPSLFWETTVLYAERKGVKVKRVPLTADMDIDLAAMEAAVDPSVALVHICNPNNPTGKHLDPAALKGFCLRVSKKATVLVDEAYNELMDDPAGNSVMDLVRAGENVIVARTFSKIYGMAGMRIGYMMTTPAHAKTIDGYVMSWMGAPQVAAGVAAYNDEAFLTFSKAKVVEGRQMVLEAVKSAGLTALPAQTNFLFVKVPDAAALQKAMAERNIMIRGPYGKLTQYSRVSMGKIEDVARYCTALKEIYAA